MNINRRNLMGLALFALLFNSGLAQAADRITSVTPSRAQPGQVVTLHGQFSVANFRSRQYRIMLNKEKAPRPQGAINGFVNAFRVTPTSAMVRIPRKWRGKPVYPGKYFISIRDVVRHRPVTRFYARLLIALEARTPLEVAKKTILGQVKKSQQQRLGGNIGQAASPRSPYGRGNIGAGIAKGTLQMKLTLKNIKVNNRSALYSGVSIGDRVVAWFNIQNLGTTSQRVKVGYMVHGRPQVSSNGFVNVAPGQTLVNVVNIRMNASYTHPLRGAKGIYWSPVFALLTTGNNPYRDSYMADNVVRGGSLANIIVIAHVNLAVEKIDKVVLHNVYLSGSYGDPEYGTMHPSYLTALIHIKNKGIATSRPAHVTVTLTSIQQGHSVVQNSRARELRRGGSCRFRNGSCPISQNVTVASIPAGQLVAIPVRFNNIPYSMWMPAKRGVARMASGPYLCDNRIPGDAPSHVRVAAHISQARGAFGENRIFRNDDTLVQTGTFGNASRMHNAYTECGLTNIQTPRR